MASKADLKELEACIDINLTIYAAKIDWIRCDPRKWLIPLNLGQAEFIEAWLNLL